MLTVDLFAAILDVQGLAWATLRSAGILAIGLSWMIQYSAAQGLGEHSENTREAIERLERQIKEAWVDHGGLSLDQISKRKKARDAISKQENELYKLKANTKGANLKGREIIFRGLLLIFNLLSAHLLFERIFAARYLLVGVFMSVL